MCPVICELGFLYHMLSYYTISDICMLYVIFFSIYIARSFLYYEYVVHIIVQERYNKTATTTTVLFLTQKNGIL